MDKSYSAKLKNTKLKNFRAHLDSFPMSFFGKGVYGRCPKDARPPENMFSHNTTLQVREEHGRFHYLYADKERGDIVARVVAVRFREDELSINIAWDEQAAGNYIGNLIFSIKHSWKDALIDSSGSPKDTTRRAGRKTLACNVWLEHMVGVKNRKIGSYSRDNELFQMWKNLYLFETGKDPDNPDDVADPWRSFTAAAAVGKK